MTEMFCGTCGNLDRPGVHVVHDCPRYQSPTVTVVSSREIDRSGGVLDAYYYAYRFGPSETYEAFTERQVLRDDLTAAGEQLEAMSRLLRRLTRRYRDLLQAAHRQPKSVWVLRWWDEHNDDGMSVHGTEDDAQAAIVAVARQDNDLDQTLGDNDVLAAWVNYLYGKRGYAIEERQITGGSHG